MVLVPMGMMTSIIPPNNKNLDVLFVTPFLPMETTVIMLHGISWKSYVNLWRVLMILNRVMNVSL